MIYCESNNSNGRLGNFAMRVMSLMGMAKKYNTDWAVPVTHYAKYFENDIPQRQIINFDLKIKEPHYHYTPEYWGKIDFSKTVDIWGYLQSPLYWQELLSFKEDYKELIKTKYSITGNELAISIRRGDFVSNPSYFQLPITYYLTALINHFPDWRTRRIFIFSDDIAYCKHHFEALDNVHYVQGSDIEQLCAMTQCADFIISNSTFSYVGAYLAQRGKVIRPVKNMDGPLAAKNSEHTYWPENWVIHETQKLDLKDTTFTIPVYYDHDDRKKNLDLSVCMLQRDFDTNIIIGEQKKQDFKYMNQWCKYMHFDIPEFHRTKMLNDMCIEATTPVVYNWDADIFIAPLQVYLAVDKVRNGNDFIYPYDGRFARVPRMRWFAELERNLDTAIFANQGFKGKNGKDVVSSVGGAVCFNKESFIDAGMENENMISYAPEDCERWDRFHTLGYKVGRVKGVLYHIDHFIGVNSSGANSRFKDNHAELDKIRAMNAQELRAYVDSWSWVNKYSEGYYSRIAPGAVESAKIIYEAIGFNKGSVIDIGCGLGEWSNNNPLYVGVDYKVMKRSLMFPVEHYYDYDLCSLAEFPVKGKFDLCLCLEVLEHVPEEFASRCVELLCSLSDTVLFSAAIPFQGGLNHCNEQWQSWWAEKFKQNGFGAVRTFREVEGLECWYCQNIVLYKRSASGLVTDHIDKQMWLNVAGRKTV